MQVVFYKRSDYTSKLPINVDVEVERYKWHMEGGPIDATLSVPAVADKWELKKLLRCPVEIYGDNKAVPLWWGFVSKVTIPHGVQRFGYGLDGMYNHITVKYSNEGESDAATNAVSISEYGQKELIIRSYNLSGLEAAQLRATELEDKQNPKKEIEFTGGDDRVIIECAGWYDTLRWKHYTNTTEGNVSNTTQISTIVASVGQFINGTLIEDVAGVVSNQIRDARDGLSCVNELLQAGTSNNRPLLASVDRNRYLHVWERSADPIDGGDVDYVMRDDGSLEELAGGAKVPDEFCTVAKWVRAKGSPVDFSFFIESAEYDVASNKTTYRPADSYEQQRLAKFIADVVTGDGPHVWPSLIPSGLDDPQLFEPFWVALGKEGDSITAVRGAAWDSTNNILYVTGQFTVIGGVAAVNFAKLDMATGQWYALNTTGAPGSTNYGWAAAIANSKVYFGTQGSGVGCFWEYDDATDTWTDLSSGTSGPCNTLEVDGTDVYLGGAFTSMPSSANSHYISKYNGATFDALGTGIDYTPAGTGGVYDMVIDSGILYAVGKFDDAGGTSVVNVAAWNGSSWAAVGGGLGSVGDSLGAVAAKNGYIYADNGLGNNYLCQWDGTQWTTIGIFDGAIEGLITSEDEQYLYIIGAFTTVDSLSVGNSAYWDGSAFYAMNDGLSGASLANASWALFDELHPIAVGNFTLADGNPALGVAMYITTLQGLIEHLTNTGGVARPGGPNMAVQSNLDGRFFGEKDFLYKYDTNNLFLGSALTPDDEASYTNTFFHSRDGGAPTYYSRGWGNFSPRWLGSYAKGSKASPTAPVSGDVLFRFWATIYDTDDWDNLVAILEVFATENHDASNQGAGWRFYVMPNGQTGAGNLVAVAEFTEGGIDLAAGTNFSVDGTVIDNWDGDIADIDVTSSADIGEAIADTDQGIIYNTSGTAWVRFAWSRVKTYIQALTDTLYIAISGNVSQANMEELADGSETTLHTHSYTNLNDRPAAEVQTNDIFNCASPGGTSAFVGTINGAPSGATLVYTPSSGTEAAMVPASTSHLGKMRLYNTTRSEHLLILDCNTGTNTLTFTASVPGTWQNGDTITIASQTVTGSGFDMVDVEITSGLTGKTDVDLVIQILSATSAHRFTLHPFETFSASKYKNIFSVANVVMETSRRIKLVGNVFSLFWTGTPTVVLVREEGYYE